MGGRQIGFGIVGAVVVGAALWWALGAPVGSASRGDASSADGSAGSRASDPRTPADARGAHDPSLFAAASVAPAADPVPLAAPAAPAAPEEPTAPPPGEPLRVSGTVTDPDGAPLAGVDAWLLPTARTLQAAGFELAPQDHLAAFPPPPWLEGAPLDALAHARTDAEGRFVLDGRHLRAAPDPGVWPVPPTDPMVLLAASGRTTRSLACGAPGRGEIALGSFALAPEARAEGRVVDEAGRPLTGAQVRVLGATQLGTAGVQVTRYPKVRHPELYGARTDARGRFTLGGLWTGSVSLQAAAPGHVPLKRKVELPAPGTIAVEDFVLARGAVLAGTVTGADGAPLPGAEVLASAYRVDNVGGGCVVIMVPDGADSVELERVTARERGAPRTLTDEQGRFRLEGLDGFTFGVYVAANGHESVRVLDVAGGSEDLRVALACESLLHVRVVDAATGEPLADPEAVAWRTPAPSLRGAEIPVEAVADGLLVHRVGPVGTRLEVQAPGHARASVKAPGVEAPGGRGTFTIELQPAAELSGRVLSSDGASLADALVELLIVERDLAAAAHFVRTDASGVFRFPHLSDGERFVPRASKPGHVTVRADPVELSIDTPPADLELRLPRGARVEGTVVDAQGEPPRYVQLRLDRAPFDPPYEEHAQRDWEGHLIVAETGRFAFTDLPPGHYRLEPELLPPVEFDLVEGQVERFELQLRAEPVVRGRVLAGGEPMVGAIVQGTPDRSLGMAPRDPVRTDELGEYRMALESAGRFTIEVRRAGAFDRFDTLPGGVEVELAWGEQRTVDLALPGARVEGRAVDAADGTPRADVEVLLFTVPPSEPAWAPLHAMTTGADGSFFFEGLEPGSYRLRTESYAASWQHVEVALGPVELGPDSTERVTLELDRGAVISGAVRTPSGALFPGSATLRVRGVDGTRGEHASFIRNGRYSVAGLGPGTWRLIVEQRLAPAQAAPDAGTVVTLSAGEHLELDLLAE